MAWLTAADVLWRGLRRSWLVVACAVAFLVLFLAAVLLPQLPGLLSGDATASTRWLAGASADYGVLGELLRALGFFNVLHSLLLQLLLAVVTLILLVYTGDAIALVLRYRRLPGLLQQPISEQGEPLDLPPGGRTLYRRRFAAPQPPDEVVGAIRQRLSRRYEQVESAEVRTRSVADLAEGASEAGPPEQRLLAMRNRRWVPMRLLLLVGLLLALVTIWLVVVAGWELSTPVLAPGAEFRLSNHAITLQYSVTHTTAGVEPQLNIQVSPASAVFPVAATGSIDGVNVRVRPSLPSLYVTTTGGEPALARAGQTETNAGLGLTFPSPGSEESIILPNEAIGLRVVRLGEEAAGAAGAGFLLEVYRGESSQPARRMTIGAERVERVALNEGGLALEIVQLPGVVVDFRHTPGLWLLWPALALVLAGALSFWYRPAFLLIQVAPWPVQRSVVVAQSDDPAALAPVLIHLVATEESTP
jgi:hypothetical protein